MGKPGECLRTEHPLHFPVNDSSYELHQFEANGATWPSREELPRVGVGEKGLGKVAPVHRRAESLSLESVCRDVGRGLTGATCQSGTKCSSQMEASLSVRPLCTVHKYDSDTASAH